MTSRSYKFFTQLVVIAAIFYAAVHLSFPLTEPAKATGKPSKVIDTIAIIDGDTLFQYASDTSASK